jgi:hypothetical protein
METPSPPARINPPIPGINADQFFAAPITLFPALLA